MVKCEELCSVFCICVFCRPQDQVVRVLWPVRCVRVRRSALHEGKTETEPAVSVSAVVAQPGHLQVSHPYRPLPLQELTDLN